MSKQPDDGGPAFPQVPLSPTTSAYGGIGHPTFGGLPAPVIHQPGMSLRDYFAGQALISCAATGALYGKAYENAASYAYALADDMLTARTRSTEQEG